MGNLLSLETMVVFYQYDFEVEAKKPNSNHHRNIYAPPPFPPAPNIGQHRETMEDHESSALAAVVIERAEVDTTRPFRSVKEAIAVFGERLLSGDAYSQKTISNTKIDITPKPIYALPAPNPIFSASSSPPSYTSSASQFNQDREDELIIFSSLKKLEAELEETKRELMLVKEKEAEMEIAVAGLNGQLQKSMSKLAEMEATKAAEDSMAIEGQSNKARSDRWAEERTRDLEAKFDYLPTLAQALSLGGIEDEFGGRKKRKVPKKKPIIPLIGDMFSRKKASFDINNSPYSQSYNCVLS